MADRLGTPIHGEVESVSDAGCIRFGSFSLGDFDESEDSEIWEVCFSR
jgi:hypothetical protein